MAINIGDLQGSIGLEDDFSAAIEKVAESISGAIDKMVADAEKPGEIFSGMFGTIVEGSAVVIASIGAIGAAIATLGYQGSTIVGIEDAFGKLANTAGMSSEAIVSSMDEAAKGTVDSVDLMTDANKVLGSGAKVTVEDFALLTASARELGKAAGKDTAAELETLSSAFASGRTKALQMQGVIVDTAKYEKQLADSLGITADQLSKTGQQEAARMGILAALQERLDRLGISQMSFKEILQATGTAIGNFFDDIKKAVDQSDAVRGALDAIGKGFTDIFGGTRQTALDMVVAGINAFANAVTASVPYVVSFAKGVEDLWAWLVKLNDEYKITSTIGSTLSSAFSIAVEAIKGLYDIVAGTVKIIAELPPWMKELAAGALAVAPAVYGANKALETISVGANAAQVAWGFLSAAVSKREWIEAILTGSGQIKTTMSVLGSGVEDTAAIFTKMFVDSQTASTSWGGVIVGTFKSVGASVTALLGPFGLLVAAFTLLTGAAVAMLEIPWVRTMTEWVSASDSWAAAIARMVLQMPKLGTEAELAAKKTLESTQDAGQGITFVAQTVTEQIGAVVKSGSMQDLEDIAIRLGNQGRLSAEALHQIGDAALKFKESGGTLPPALENIVAGLSQMDAATKKSSSSLIDHGKVAEDAAKKAKAFNEAWTELNSLGATVADTLAGVNQETQDSAMYYFKAGASVEQVANAFQLTSTQAKALHTEFERQKSITEALDGNMGTLHKAMTEIIDDQMKLAQANTAKYFESWKSAIDLTTAAQEDYSETWRRLNMTDYEIAVDNIDRWEAKQYAALDANEAATSDMYGVIANTAAIKMEEVNRTHDAAIADMKAGWDDFGNMATKWLNSVPNLITAAFTGGGGMREAMVGLGSQIGGDLGKSLGTSVASNMSGMLNDAFGADLGGKLGNAIGPAAGAATSASMANILSGNAGMGSYITAGVSIGGQIGMAAGGPAGAAIGAGIGAAAGAIASLIVGKPEWKKAASDIGRDMGVKISDELAKAIAETEKVEGLERIQAATLHLMDIITEAGGLTASNVEMFTGKLRDTFVYLGRDEMTLEQATQTLDSTFGAFAENALKGNGLLSASLKEIIDLDQRAGTESAAIAQFVVNQTDAAVKGLTDLFGAFKSGVELTQASATAFGDTVAASFGEMLNRGIPLKDALSAVAGATTELQAAMEKAGVSGSEAFNNLATLSAAAADPIQGPLINAILGADEALKGLHNSNLLTQESFTAITETASASAAKLQEMGLSGAQVGQIMQPTLQTIWELQQKFNYTVDEGTQAMLDQAVAAGTVGDAHKSAQERIADATDRVAFAVEGLARAFGVDIPEAVDKGIGAMGTAIDSVAGKADQSAGEVTTAYTNCWTQVEGRTSETVATMTAALAALPGVSADTAARMQSDFYDQFAATDLTATEKIDHIAEELMRVGGVSEEQATQMATSFYDSFTQMSTSASDSAEQVKAVLMGIPGVSEDVATQMQTSFYDSFTNTNLTATEKLAAVSAELQKIPGISKETADAMALSFSDNFAKTDLAASTTIATMTTNLQKLPGVTAEMAGQMQKSFTDMMNNNALTTDQKVQAISGRLQTMTGVTKDVADAMAFQFATTFDDMKYRGDVSATGIEQVLQRMKNTNTGITGGMNMDWKYATDAMQANMGYASGTMTAQLQTMAGKAGGYFGQMNTNSYQTFSGMQGYAYSAAQNINYALGGIQSPHIYVPITYYETNANPAYQAKGGVIPQAQYLAEGAAVRTATAFQNVFTPRGTDTVPAMLTPGEGVVNLGGMQKIGRAGLAAINAGDVSATDLTGATGTDYGGQPVLVHVSVEMDGREIAEGMMDTYEQGGTLTGRMDRMVKRIVATTR